MSVLEVVKSFGQLGLTSFGGPVAHLGYFRTHFVEKKRWMSNEEYADTVALCQFLPGPASSQVSMIIGLKRAGLAGMLAAWVMFTIPSALLLIGFYYGAAALPDGGWISGLKAAATAVVAHAVWTMGRSILTDVPRLLIALAATATVLLLPSVLTHVGVISLAAIIGYLVLTASAGGAGHLDGLVSSRLAVSSLVTFLVLLVGLPLVAATGVLATIASVFYSSGALVFGGGHVVLPLLQEGTAGLVETDTFLAGYGAAQAVPGPLFTFAAFLGQAISGWSGAVVALVAIFLPGALLVLAAVPLWSRLGKFRGAVAGANAAVVGILAAALITPVIPAGITSLGTGIIALGCLAALCAKAPTWLVVIAAGACGALLPG